MQYHYQYHSMKLKLKHYQTLIYVQLFKISIQIFGTIFGHFRELGMKNCKKFNFVKIKYISYSKIIEKKNFRYCTLISFGNSQDKRTIERKSLMAMYRPRRRTFD